MFKNKKKSFFCKGVKKPNAEEQILLECLRYLAPLTFKSCRDENVKN